LTAIFACNAKSRDPCMRKCERAYANDQAKGTVEGTSYLNIESCYKNNCGLVLVHTHGFRSEHEDEGPCMRECERADVNDQAKGTVEDTSYLNIERCYKNKCGLELVHTDGFGSEDEGEVAEEEVESWKTLGKALKQMGKNLKSTWKMITDKRRARRVESWKTLGKGFKQMGKHLKSTWKMITHRRRARRALREDLEDVLKDASADQLADIFFEEELAETEGIISKRRRKARRSEEEVFFNGHIIAKAIRDGYNAYGGRRALREDSEEF